MEILCPLCGKPLTKQTGAMVCENRHNFDIARQGYVNLLPVQQKHSLHPGDTPEQVRARRQFLDGGFYAPIAEAVCFLASQSGCQGPILDVGCGEGYYSAALAEALQAELVGLDISKEAVRYAAGRHKHATWLCASAAKLPVGNASVGVLTSLFALTLPEEFRRVLRKDGVFIQVLAAADHLLALKSVIYPQLTEKVKESTPQLSGFSLEKSIPVRFSFTVQGEQVVNLLSMTPHVYRISKEGLERLRQLEELTDTTSCVVNLYRPL